jgi:hypothetical protein
VSVCGEIHGVLLISLNSFATAFVGARKAWAQSSQSSLRALNQANETMNYE